MRRKDILRKLEERLARGEINEKTYLEIKARYESEPEEPEELGEAELPHVDLGATIGNAVAREDGRVPVRRKRPGSRLPHRRSGARRGRL